MQLSEEQLAQAIAGLDSPGRSRVAALIAEEPARALAAAIIRRFPHRQRASELHAVQEVVARAGEQGLTLTQIGRRLKMPAAVVREQLDLLIRYYPFDAEIEKPKGRGRPAIRVRARRN
jgi:hypothetical protein